MAVVHLRRACFALAIVVMAFAAAGCGSKSASPTEKWAGNFCSDFSSFADSLKSAGKTVKQNPTKSGVQDAATQAKKAAKTFASDLKKLGKPPTSSGKEAQKQLDQLATQLSGDAATLKSATNDVSSAQEAVTAIGTVSQTLSSVVDQVSATLDKLRQLDTKGELDKAFKNADSCKALQQG